MTQKIELTDRLVHQIRIEPVASSSTETDIRASIVLAFDAGIESVSIWTLVELPEVVTVVTPDDAQDDKLDAHTLAELFVAQHSAKFEAAYEEARRVLVEKLISTRNLLAAVNFPEGV
jgi:hypothetical protein